MTKKICEVHKLTSILKIVGNSNEVDLLGEKVSTTEWNPLHFAIYYKHLDLVKFYLEELKVTPFLSLLGPLSQDEGNDTYDPIAISELIVPFPSINMQCFSLVLTINNRDE